jgi:hypothetical protein
MMESVLDRGVFVGDRLARQVASTSVRFAQAVNGSSTRSPKTSWR